MKALLMPLALLFCLTKAVAQTPLLNSYTPATAVLYLDFDGQEISGTNWNVAGPLYCGPANLNAAQITEIFNRISEDFRPFNLNVTTDSAVYEAAPIDRRMRVLFTITSDWYGIAGGVAYTNSFTWGNNTPCFVFTALHRYNIKNIAEAGSHEAGHTLGLRHQALYDSTCRKISDYNNGTGTGVVGWAPIMGAGYSRNITTWNFGPNPFGCTNDQDDLAIITSGDNGFGYRPDEDTATAFATAPAIKATAYELSDTGLIATNTDSDLFQLAIPASGPVALTVQPYSVGANDAGANLDVAVQLYDNNQQLVGTYNPAGQLSASIDTTLTAGTYYLSVSGTSGPFASRYASLGTYTIKGHIPEAGPVVVRLLQLRGSAAGNHQQLNWMLKADAPVSRQVVERAGADGSFSTVAVLPPDARSFSTTHIDNTTTYRLHVFFDFDRQQYSNLVQLQRAAVALPQLYTNVIHSNTLFVNSPSAFHYTITDVAGQVLQKGSVKTGANTISMSFSKTGLYVISFENGGQRGAQKFWRD